MERNVSHRWAIIKRGNERLQVEDDGDLAVRYAGCEIIERDLPKPTQEAPVRKNGRWSNDEEEIKTRRLGAHRLDPAALLERLDILEARVAELESRRAPN